MARVTGIGGIFLRARDPKSLSAWYAKHLGIQLSDYGGVTFLWKDEVPATTGMTTWSLFPADTKYFGPGQQSAMINYRVDDLDALLTQLAAANVDIDPKREDADYGRFAWITDPEGNRLELWQPLVQPEEDTPQIKGAHAVDLQPKTEQAQPNVQQAVPFFWVADIEASLRFYVDGLDFTMTKKWTPKGKVEWCWLQLGAVALMLQEYRPGKIPDNKRGEGVSICFQCQDAIAIYRDAVSRGIQAKRPFVGNGLWVTSIRDPDGYGLEFESPTDAPEESILPE